LHRSYSSRRVLEAETCQPRPRAEFYKEKESKSALSFLFKVTVLLFIIKWISDIIEFVETSQGELGLIRLRMPRASDRKRNWAVRIKISTENLSFIFFPVSDCRVNMRFDEYTHVHKLTA